MPAQQGAVPPTAASHSRKPKPAAKRTWAGAQLHPQQEAKARHRCKQEHRRCDDPVEAPPLQAPHTLAACAVRLGGVVAAALELRILEGDGVAAGC
jgi:hypothetical protein